MYVPGLRSLMSPRFGYHLSSEEQPPQALVRCAAEAEENGFDLAFISDHYHPWIDQQGESPFAWAVLGAIAQATTRLQVGTAVTCPSQRYHPALVAQMAATMGALFEGRFFLGLGSGEYLNEHIYGQHWRSLGERGKMLEEAIAIIRKLWEGGLHSFEGKYFTVESARIYTLPEPLPPIYLAASGPSGARQAAQLAEGMIGVAPQPELVDAFREAGGEGRLASAKVMVCWAPNEAEALRTAHTWWPVAGLDGKIMPELRLPSYFEAAVKPVRPDDVRTSIAIGPDPAVHLNLITKYVDAGYDQIVLHQIGPDQQGFFRFWREELQPELKRRGFYGGATE